MKKQRRSLWRKGIHFAFSEKWNTGGLPRLHAEKLPSSARNSDHESCGEKNLLKAVAGLPANSVVGQANGRRPRTAPHDFPMTCSGESQSPGESGKIVVTLSKHKRKRFCYGCFRGLERHRNGGLLIPRKVQLNQHRRIKVSPLMMYEKLSMIRFQYRILRSQHFRTKSKVCKLRKAQRSWVQKVTGDHQETFRDNVEGGSCSPFPSAELRDSSCRHQLHAPDMDSDVLAKGKNSPMPEGCTKGSLYGGKEPRVDDTFPDQQNGVATDAWDQTPCSPQWECAGLTGEHPLSEHHLSNMFPSETQRDALALSRENGTGAVGDSKVELSAPGAEEAGSGADGPGSHQNMEHESCQMEEEGSLKQNILSSKLLDHPYCKSPLEAPLVCSELKLESPLRGGKNSQKASPVDDEQLSICLSGFLDEVMKKYGSLVPLSEKDVLARLKDVFNEDFSNRKPFINREITNYRARHQKCNFRIFYNKHMLDMDDLATLDGQNWLNDQVINMYGELIMDAVPDKVHFFNSFFHRQLVTKGYNGVKRWTKKVDLFKKSLLLIPIHLEVHWSLITVTLSNRIISFYDSQGIHFKFCVENIRKYLLTEAREKNRPEFLQGWQTAVTKCIPQQKNDSDCGVFVLQYCKCLALEQPFQFSQEDMPRVRKRIYKELCECRLLD
ncbi:PREDICTED: sentrin-specific protease 5 isoform X3 [Chinchilla lanigera]|uniref:sentrin-specific protease 5 isoform X3 n=1 Tax=Chinchilla lanigera TaxID=34839 RepID=UPI00038EEC89|nr:PREDICTED: sentrin-specific protease 5 isoform X3 [Chinchilla lanigera]